MTKEYSRCDMEWLLQQSKVPDAAQFEAHGKTYDLPVAFFDNGSDLTTFLRKDQADWTDDEIDAIDPPLAETCTKLWASYQKIYG